MKRTFAALRMIAKQYFLSCAGASSHEVCFYDIGLQSNFLCHKKGASAILANSFLLLFIMASLLTVLTYFFKDFLLIKFGATEMIFPYAEAYMRVYLVGTAFSVLSLGLNPFLICQGFAGLAMTSVVIGALFSAAVFLCVIPRVLRRRETAVKSLTSDSPAPYSQSDP